MPAGMQCWDASGKLIVDIGDYNTRYLGRVTATMPAGTGLGSVITGGYSGLTANGSFVVVAAVSSSSYTTTAEFSARAYNGGFRVYKLNRNYAAATLTLDLYSFL